MQMSLTLAAVTTATTMTATTTTAMIMCPKMGLSNYISTCARSFALFNCLSVCLWVQRFYPAMTPTWLQLVRTQTEKPFYWYRFVQHSWFDATAKTTIIHTHIIGIGFRRYLDRSDLCIDPHLFVCFSADSYIYCILNIILICYLDKAGHVKKL